jgi:hypothetical protein
MEFNKTTVRSTIPLKCKTATKLGIRFGLGSTASIISQDIIIIMLPAVASNLPIKEKEFRLQSVLDLR